MSKLREYLEAFLIAVIFLKFANTFVLQTFYIPSASMEETLLIGDHLFVNRFIYGPRAFDWEEKVLPLRSLQRGDVVIFRSKEDLKTDVVKRCVGLPGDVVEVRADQLMINGAVIDDDPVTKYEEPYELQRLNRLEQRRRSQRRAYFGPIQVPEDQYFCMGDNRWNSYDSRFWGPLPAYLVKGRASVIYWSLDSERDGQYIGMRPTGLLTGEFWKNTRWARSFQLVR